MEAPVSDTHALPVEIQRQDGERLHESTDPSSRPPDEEQAETEEFKTLHPEDGDVDTIHLEETDATTTRPSTGVAPLSANNEQIKQAWVRVVPPPPPFPNIFEFIDTAPPLPEPVTPVQVHTAPSEPIEVEENLADKKPATTVTIPAISTIENYSPLALRIDPRDGLHVTQALQAEKTYVPPTDWSELGWREIYQLGVSLAYTTMLLRRDISPRFLVLDEDLSPNAVAFRPLRATACAVLATSGLPFNQSTEEFVIRQRMPVENPKPNDAKKSNKKNKNKRSTVASPSKRKYLVRPALSSPVKRTPANPTPRHQSRLFSSNKMSDVGAIAVFRALRVNTSLRSLALSNVGLTDVATGALAAMLRVNCTLTALSLHRNSITHIGIQVICEALEDSPDSVLLRLDLSHNTITDTGVPAICHALEENETLVWLDLSWNQLSSKALLMLLRSLRGNFCLRELSVFGKDLDEDQYTLNLESKYAHEIAAAFRQVNASLANVKLSSGTALLPVDKMKSSRWLTLPSRDLVELDALVISGLVPLNDRLLSLDLSDNRGIERWAILEILKSIKFCKTLKHVNLANTGLFEEVGEQVGDLVATNTTLETITMHAQALHVQQLRGKDAVEILAFQVAADHFFDKWILAKCLVLNRATQELNQLRLPQPRAALITGGVPKKGSTNYSLRKLELYEVVFLARKVFYHLAMGCVSLNGCGITSHGGIALADGVRNHASLESLEIENNHIGVAGGTAMAECVAFNASLTFLNLSWNKIGNDGVAGLERALHANKSLLRLDLRGNMLSAPGIQAIANGLKGNACLQELYLRWNTVCATGAQALAQALTSNKTLRLLDIEHHTMDAKGARAFATMLALNNRLQELNMKGDDAVSDGDATGIGSDAAARLADTLTHENKTLTVLNLAQNQIGRDGIMSFCDVVKFNKTIHVLDLSISDMDGKIAIRFFECLAMNTTIVKLNLAHNRISNEGMMACIRLLEVNKVLETLNVAHNAITEEPLALLAARWLQKKQQQHQVQHQVQHRNKPSPTRLSIVPSAAVAPVALKWLCLTGNTMTERTRQALKAIPPMVTIELDEELHQMPAG